MPNNHADGCEWIKTDFYLYYHNPDGADESVRIDSNQIIYNGSPSECQIINFNFCPICGCSLHD